MASAAVAGEDLGEPVFKRNGSIIYRKITGYTSGMIPWKKFANFQWSISDNETTRLLTPPEMSSVKVEKNEEETFVQLLQNNNNYNFVTANSYSRDPGLGYLNIDECFAAAIVYSSDSDDEDDDDEDDVQPPQKKQRTSPWRFTKEFKIRSHVKDLALQEIEKYLTRENDYSVFRDLKDKNLERLNDVDYDKGIKRALLSNTKQPTLLNDINKLHDVINSSLQIYDIFGSAKDFFSMKHSNDMFGMKNELMFGKILNIYRGYDIDKINKDMNYMRFMYFVLENFLNAEDRTVIKFENNTMSLKGVHEEKEGYHESQCNPYFGIDDIEPTNNDEATVDTQWLYYALCSKKFPMFYAISFDELQNFNFNAEGVYWVDKWKKCSALLQDVLKKEYESPSMKRQRTAKKREQKEKNLYRFLERPNLNATEAVTYNFKTMFDIVYKITSKLKEKDPRDYLISSLVYMSGTKSGKKWAKKFRKSKEEYADVQQMLKARRYIFGSLIHMQKKEKKVYIVSDDSFDTVPLIKDVSMFNKFTQFVYKTRQSLGLVEASLEKSVAEFDDYLKNVIVHFKTERNSQIIKCCKALEFYLCDKEMTSEPMKDIVNRSKKNNDKIRSSDFKTLSKVSTNDHLIWRSSDKSYYRSRSEEIYVFHSIFKRPLLKNYRRKFSYENFTKTTLMKDPNFSFNGKRIWMYDDNGDNEITLEDLKNAKRVAFKRDVDKRGKGRFTEVFCAFVKDTTFYVARVIIDNNVNDGIGSIIQKCDIDSDVHTIGIEDNTQPVVYVYDNNGGRLNFGALEYEINRIPKDIATMNEFNDCFRFENYMFYRESNGQIKLQTYENSNEDNFLRAYVYNGREMLSFFEIGIDVRWNDWKNIQKKFDDNLLLAKNWFIKDDYGDYHIVSDFMSNQSNDYKTVVFRSPGMPVREEMTLEYDFNKYDTLMKVGDDRYVSIKYAKKIEKRSKEHVGMVPITKRSKKKENIITMFYDRGIQNKENGKTPQYTFQTKKQTPINKFYPNLGFVVCSDSDFHDITDNRKSDTVDEYDNMVTSLKDLSLRF